MRVWIVQNARTGVVESVFTTAKAADAYIAAEPDRVLSRDGGNEVITAAVRRELRAAGDVILRGHGPAVSPAVLG